MEALQEGGILSSPEALIVSSTILLPSYCSHVHAPGVTMHGAEILRRPPNPARRVSSGELARPPAAAVTMSPVWFAWRRPQLRLWHIGVSRSDSPNWQLTCCFILTCNSTFMRHPPSTLHQLFRAASNPASAPVGNPGMSGQTRSGERASFPRFTRKKSTSKNLLSARSCTTRSGRQRPTLYNRIQRAPGKSSLPFTKALCSRILYLRWT
ncbi:hypothetical protein BC834DRAFT_661619 [Gloeopeniophorella convolvens]|nr:hypothetical protein BC834DRAFT_661619 [Gloeopeniophorella convolvens]